MLQQVLTCSIHTRVVFRVVPDLVHRLQVHYFFGDEFLQQYK